MAGIIGGFAYLAHKNRELNIERNKRMSTVVRFDNGISESRFRELAFYSAKQIKKKRLSISFNGPIVYGTVQSQTGLSSWDFVVDFNDYGKITGNYWLSSENDDSNIPSTFANYLSSYIIDELNSQNKDDIIADWFMKNE